MQFSNDRVSWSDIENYSVDKLWELSAGNGEKTVYVRLFDRAGNEVVYSSTITLILATSETSDDSDSEGGGSLGLMGLMLLLSGGYFRICARRYSSMSII